MIANTREELPTRFLPLLLVAGVAVAVPVAFGCNGPTGLLPGGALEGPVAPAPEDWSALDIERYGTAQLETRPDDPYSVNVVYTVVGGSVYVNAGNTETNWVVNITANPAVRLRIDDTLYALRAERVTDASEIESFAAAWTSQSTFRRDPTELDGEVWIYRLVER